jgi:hypothetical protein
MKRTLALAVGWAGLALAGAAAAGEADVLDVKVQREPAGTWRFAVTLRHADEGLKHYADRWEVVAPDGKVLATRVLEHPHVKEQPVTRSLAGVKIPAGVKRVTVRAHDKVHGAGGKELTIELPR